MLALGIYNKHLTPNLHRFTQEFPQLKIQYE